MIKSIEADVSSVFFWYTRKEEINRYFLGKAAFIMNKHAYLIMADQDFEQLEVLLPLLDDVKNDFFIHVDKKISLTADNQRKIQECVKKSRVNFVKRLNVNWGAPNQVWCELNLLKTAHQNHQYSYYHFLSAKDLPLQSTQEIYSFFEQHQGKNFIEFLPVNREVKNRVAVKHAFPTVSAYRSTNNKFLQFLIRLYRKCERGVQNLMHLDAFAKYQLDLAYGSNWVSITQEVVDEILRQEAQIKKMYQYSILCDEIFIQTVVLNHPKLKATIAPEGNLRYLDFENGDSSPKTFTQNDFQDLINAKKSGMIFARKFNAQNDNVIINQWIKEGLKHE